MTAPADPSGHEPDPGRPPRLRAALLFVAVLIAYAFTASGHLFSPDEELYFRMTRSLARGEGLAVAPLAEGFATRPPRARDAEGRWRTQPRADGREYAQYGIGQPLLAVPFYLAGEALARAGDDRLWQRLYNPPALTPGRVGYAATAAELAPRFAVSWFNIVVGALLAVLVYLLAFEVTRSARGAAWGAVLYAFGTLAWAHSRPFFSESLAALMIVLAWWALLRGARASEARRSHPGRSGRAALAAWCALAGAAAGYAALVRLDSIFAYPGLALVLLGPVRRAAASARAGEESGGSPWPAWLAFALPAAACGALILGLNWLHFGSPLATGYDDQPEGVSFSAPLLAGLFGFLFSVGKGLFFFSPALALSLPGWSRFRWSAPAGGAKAIAPAGEPIEAEDGFIAEAPPAPLRDPWLAWGLALAVLVPLAVHATWINWAGGWCWGPRHIFLIHPLLALPLAAWLAAPGWNPARRVTALVVLLVGAGVQLLGSSQDFIDFHQRFFRAPGDNAMFFIQYDPSDRAFWEMFYQLQFRAGPGQPARPIGLYPPAPIQDSIYVPQRSAWAGYPRMLRGGSLDWFWWRALAVSTHTPAAETNG